MKAILKGTAILLLVGALFSIAFGGAYVPDVLSDHKISRLATIPASGSKIDSARCSGFMFVVSWCDVSYTKTEPAGASGEFRYLLAGSYSGAQVRLLQTREQPARFSSNFGIDHLQNRTITLLVVLAIFVVGPFGPLLSVLLISIRSKRK